MKYYLQYKGWNSRYEVVSIVSITKDLEPETEVDNNTDSSKFSPPEVCIVVLKIFCRKLLM